MGLRSALHQRFHRDEVSLQLDDILMLRPLDRYEVRINQQKLFRGTIFEEDGALFLTSLESVNPQ